VEREVPPSDSNRVRGFMEWIRLAVWAVPSGGVCSLGGSKALGAWRYVSPASQSGSNRA